MAAGIAALFLLLIGCFWLVPKFGTNHISPKETYTAPAESTVQPAPQPTQEPEQSKTLNEETDHLSSPEPLSTIKPKDYGEKTEYAFTLDIQGKKVNVAYGVDEATLGKAPGWLTTSASPGEDGTCVVYGHRNRKHLRVLEKVQIGDVITVSAQSGEYSYTVQSIRILENEEPLSFAAAQGKELALVTCYPFRYAGSAPKKCVVLARA